MNTDTEHMDTQTRLAYLQEQNVQLWARVMYLERRLASQEHANRRLIELLSERGEDG